MARKQVVAYQVLVFLSLAGHLTGCGGRPSISDGANVLGVLCKDHVAFKATEIKQAGSNKEYIMYYEAEVEYLKDLDRTAGIGGVAIEVARMQGQMKVPISVRKGERHRISGNIRFEASPLVNVAMHYKGWYIGTMYAGC